MNKYTKYIIAIVIATLLIIILGLIIAGGAEKIAPCENCKMLEQELNEAAKEPKSYGEIGKEIYGIEIWEDGTGLLEN